MFLHEEKQRRRFVVSPKEVFVKIAASFVPRIRPPTTDLLGPFISVSLLIGLLHYGHAYKLPSAAVSISPILAVISYALVMPLLTYALVRISQGRISLLEAVTLIGYGLFGHVLTLIVSMLLSYETSNTVFFCCAVLLGGSSALHVTVSLVVRIGKPAARLVVCSIVATLQMLSLIFLHFAYMHRTFVYGHNI